jgi:hypothetical protein
MAAKPARQAGGVHIDLGRVARAKGDRKDAEFEKF